MNTITFIGIGAQKSATSWVYACLYEHPEICAPIKEIHFFSRPRFGKGKEWYESHFSKCKGGTKKGEFSTSYLYSKEAPERIVSMYRNIKLIAVLRNPVDRAYSQYGNAIKGGEIKESLSFEEYIKQEPSCLNQGLYAHQLERYYKYFNKEQILVLIYEDIQKDPEKFMRSIYEFIGVDSSFKASMLYKRINVARVPRHHEIDKDMHYFAEFLRKNGMDKFVHLVRRTGLPDLVRKFNTKKEKKKSAPSPQEKIICAEFFKEDVEELSNILNRDLKTVWEFTP